MHIEWHKSSWNRFLSTQTISQRFPFIKWHFWAKHSQLRLCKIFQQLFICHYFSLEAIFIYEFSRRNIALPAPWHIEPSQQLTFIHVDTFAINFSSSRSFVSDNLLLIIRKYENMYIIDIHKHRHPHTVHVAPSPIHQTYVIGRKAKRKISFRRKALSVHSSVGATSRKIAKIVVGNWKSGKKLSARESEKSERESEKKLEKKSSQRKRRK